MVNDFKNVSLTIIPDPQTRIFLTSFGGSCCFSTVSLTSSVGFAKSLFARKLRAATEIDPAARPATKGFVLSLH